MYNEYYTLFSIYYTLHTIQYKIYIMHYPDACVMPTALYVLKLLYKLRVFDHRNITVRLIQLILATIPH